MLSRCSKGRAHRDDVFPLFNWRCMWMLSRHCCLFKASEGSACSATAEPLNTSGPAIAYGNLTVGHNHRYLALPPTVREHFLHSTGVTFDIMIHMAWIRLTGAGGIGSPLFAVNDNLAHAVPSRWLMLRALRSVDASCWQT